LHKSDKDLSGSQKQNLDQRVVDAFGEEWLRFDQSALPAADAVAIFENYFALFPWKDLPEDAVGFDMGCGSGRWAQFVAPRIGRLHCIDASETAISVARQNLQSSKNCEFHRDSVDSIPLADNSMDFGYSLGVLHHIPDT
jgi:SAM-dependent methyltransferase